MNDRTLANSSAMSGWRKSSYSGPEAGSCVEVLDGHPSGVPVRDSKIQGGPALVFESTSWSSFVSAVKVGSVSI
ncbi:DUF397 domain-containing protein [Streptomyces griseus]|uniref:DUF397 domain-containing protein n=1 Tax=Streptomyces griseus TaxID=1911 RepID=UPI00055F519B|nr:DUF397 domain-containing protein [Streptomyces griseus]